MGYGKNICNRSCHIEWFEKWNWLHYSVANDSLFCYVCHQAYTQNKLFTNNLDKKFILDDGFSLWNKATGKDGRIPKHENSDCHKEAMEKLCSDKPSENISSVISNEYRKQEEQNRHCLIQIIDVIRLLVRQGLPLRGDDREKYKKMKNDNSDGETKNDSCKENNSKLKRKAAGGESEKTGNFHQLMLLQAKNDPILAEWMKKDTNKYTSNTSQNEIFKILYMNVNMY